MRGQFADDICLHKEDRWTIIEREMGHEKLVLLYGQFNSHIAALPVLLFKADFERVLILSGAFEKEISKFGIPESVIRTFAEHSRRLKGEVEITA